MKFAVLGSGNAARAWCAQLANKGYSVVMWEPLENQEYFPILKANPVLKLVGNVELSGRLTAVTMDINEAMAGADFVLVLVPAFAHKPIFEKMIPLLKDGQHVVIAPDNYGSYRLRQMMEDRGCKTKITVSGTETMPYACRISAIDTVSIYKRKTQMHLATSPIAANDEVRGVLNEAFKGYVEFLPLPHVLAAPLDNPNYILHPYPVILNYGEVEKNGKTYKHYMDGVTPLISEQMHALDEERLAIGRKLGFELDEILPLMKMYYGQNDCKNLYEYIHSPETPYADLVGQAVRSRYLTEDVPGVLMPAACLAKKAGMETPRASLIVDICSQLHGVDYWKNGTTLESIGIADKSIQQIMDMMA